MKILLKLIVPHFVFTAFLVTCSPASADGQNTTADLNQKAAIITTQYSAEDLYGDYVLLAFVSFYCKGCVKTVTTLNDIYSKYAGIKMNGIELKVAIIYVDEIIDDDEITEFAAEQNICCSLYSNSSDSYKEFSVSFLPTVFLIDTNGAVAKKYIGYRKGKVIEKDLFEIMKNN